MRAPNRYARLIEHLFLSHFREGMTEVEFARHEILEIAAELKIPVPKNIGDVVYTFRYRSALPEAITSRAPEGTAWIIRSAGPSRYRFKAVIEQELTPNRIMARTKIPDSTPGVIARYALNDEQALLARVRYNRLVDIFSGVTCYSLQNHLRTQVRGMGQLETDEIYVGLDRRGVHYVFPVQAKGGKDRLSIVQIEQDFALCAARFPDLVCRAIAAQFMPDSGIALFEFEDSPDGVRVVAERHYELVNNDQLHAEDLKRYRSRSLEGDADR